MYLIDGYAPIHPFLEHFFLKKFFPVSFSVTVRFNKKANSFLVICHGFHLKVSFA